MLDGKKLKSEESQIPLLESQNRRAVADVLASGAADVTLLITRNINMEIIATTGRHEWQVEETQKVVKGLSIWRNKTILKY